MAYVKERRVEDRVLVAKHEGKYPSRRHRRRLEDDMKMDLQEIGWGTWTRLV
jgi:hypothetical protein